MWIWEHFKRHVLVDNSGILPLLIGGGLAFGASKLMNKKGKSQMEGYNLPDWQEDPDYRETQDFLKGTGMDMMGGTIPDYYKGIGSPGGQEFEDYLSLMSGDIQKSAMESSAALGRGGGRAMEVASKAVGDFTTKSRWADYNRALEGKQWMFGQGRGITEGVRGTAQTQQGQENQFALKRSGLDFEKRSYLDTFDANQDALAGENLGALLSMGVNAGQGYSTGGIKGAVAGAMGGNDWSKILDSILPDKPKTKGGTLRDKIGKGQIKERLSPAALEQIKDMI